MAMPMVHEIDLNDLECFEIRGGGAYRIVYRAKWISRDMEVAAKKILVIEKGAAKKILVLEKEANVLSKLNHPNIIQFYGAVLKEPNLCLVTEYAENGSLYDYLQQPGNSLDFDRVIHWAKDIALGINYLHNEAPVKVIHHDINSSNVVITGDWNCKICGFGSSRFFKSTTEMSLAGTFQWMAPEVMLSEPVSESCDTWSYGVCLWELLTREVPFKGIEVFQVAWAVVEEGKRLTIPSSCPPIFGQLMTNCWNLEPKKRPTFKQILTALDNMCKDESLPSAITNAFFGNKSAWRTEIKETLTRGEHDLAAKEKDISNTNTMAMLMPHEIDRNDLKLFEKCGAGSSGSVNRAKWLSRGMEVAAKKASGIEKEASVLSILSHRNIIQFYGVVLKESNCFLVTEYAENGSLYDYLQQPGNSLDFDRIIHCAKDIALGINYLHNEAPVKVIHRDLKSPNVVITRDWDCKICDFGTSRFFKSTTNMTYVGTCSWMAPEVIRSEPVSKSCDTWSYGVCLWELLTREVPFKSMEDNQVIFAVGSGTRGLTIPSSCPPIFGQLIKNCWNSEPKKRPTFKQILTVLDNMCEDESLPSITNSFIGNKSAWRAEIDETLKKAEHDLAAKEKDRIETELAGFNELNTTLEEHEPKNRMKGFAIATLDFDAQAPSHLSLRRGDKVRILLPDKEDKLNADKRWWKGELNGKSGYFPSVFVEEQEVQLETCK